MQSQTSNRLDSLVHEQIAIDLRAHGLDSQSLIVQRVLGAAISVNGDLVQPGTFFGMMLREVSVLGDAIVESITKVLTSVRPPQDDELLSKIQKQFESQFDAVLIGIRAGFNKNWQTMSGNVSGRDRFESAVEKIRLARKHELELILEKTMKDDLPVHSNVTIYGTVGFVQTGRGNVVRANSITVDPTQTKAVLDILRRISERLDSLEELDETARLEVRGVACDAETELAKPKPNWMKLSSLISGLANAMKNITAMKELYDQLAPYLPALGVHLGQG